MLNVYDEAHNLVATMKNTDEYKEYKRLRVIAYEDDTNKALLDEYKRLQLRMQAKIASNETMPEDDFQRMQQIGSLLQFNPDVSAYLMAEYRFQIMLSNIFKILAETADVDLNMLAGS